MDIFLRAKELGFKDRGFRIKHACIECGTERWVQIRGLGKPRNLLCHKCSCQKNIKKAHQNRDYFSKNNPHWRGGQIIRQSGYILERVLPTDFFAPMAQLSHYIPQHRLVMAKHLGRNLQRWEVVHHKNGIKDDNRLENLELTTKNTHITDHHIGYREGYKQGYYDGQNTKINELQKEIKLLRWQINQFAGVKQNQNLS